MSWGKCRKVQNFCSDRKEVIKIDKDGNESVVTYKILNLVSVASYKIKFIDLCKIYGKIIIKSFW